MIARRLLHYFNNYSAGSYSIMLFSCPQSWMSKRTLIDVFACYCSSSLYRLLKIEWITYAYDLNANSKHVLRGCRRQEA
jgi:hypothetical protein